MTDETAALRKLGESVLDRALLLETADDDAKADELRAEIVGLGHRVVGAAQPAMNGAGPTERPLEVSTAKALCELPDPPRADELLGPILVRGYRTVLGGYTGEGKTTLGLQAIKAVVTEGDFLGWQGAGGRALVVDAEQGLRTIKRRLAEAGLADSEAIDFLRVPDGLALDQEQAQAAQVEQILEAGEYAVVIADPLYKLHRGDSNAEREAVDLMRLLDGWRERFGFALLLNTHPRKRPALGGKFTIDEIFGSGAYVRGAEVVLGIQRPRPGYARLHFFKDRDGDLPAGETWGLLFDRESGFRRDPEDGGQRTTTVDAVRELLIAEPGITQEALMASTKRAETTVRNALKKIGAKDEGRHPKRWYPPVGEQAEMLP